MAISSSLYSSISGLNTMGNAMSVLGDNVSNVNTVAFKSSRATFQDVLSQSVSTAAGTAQVGRGVTLSTVDGIFAQGSFESTSNPTDMAIGGQGFFMLRAGDSASADMYSRAGEFRFDQEGNLINPVGYFVQGWEIDSSGERQGTIGDINLGKSTPPVATERIQAIVNLDSREVNEVNETRLFDAWNGTNAAGVTASDPIDSGNYEYTSAVKIYDSQGASHDVTIYFDRTTNDNEWEFLVTCDPSEDLRALSGGDLVTYAPNETYNYEDQDHKGAGALMYGVLNFNTSGDITKISSWKVPPDGKVDPALNTNRIPLESTDNYYSFEANFTGESQSIEINLGASYKGVPDNQAQVLVSDQGAFSNQTVTSHITKETLWTSVYDAAGNKMDAGDSFSFSGYTNDGKATGLVTYTIGATDKVQELLSVLEITFGAKASIDADGRLKLTDNTNGDSGMFVETFTVNALSGADPFGNKINITTSKTEVVSPGQALSSATGEPPVITAITAWSTVFASDGTQVADADTIVFSGNRGDGVTVNPVTYTVNTGDGSTVQDLLDAIEVAFDADASIDGAGRLVVRDRVSNTASSTSGLTFTIDSYGGAGAAIFGAPGTSFETIAGDLTEDGSRQGDVVFSGFETEALASTQYANASTTIFQDQNGYASGFLQSVSVDTAGVITGHYSNGQVLEKAQVALATFNNMAGLKKDGGNIFTQTTESGAPVTGAPGTNGLGSIAPNSLEQSNVDLGNEFVKLITTQRGFQANSKIITTTDEMLGDLINIKR